jgi:P4 family phage/plasmid primase-like protien
MAAKQTATLMDVLKAREVPWGFLRLNERCDAKGRWKAGSIRWVGGGVYKQNCDWDALPPSVRNPEGVAYVPRPAAAVAGSSVVENQHYLAYSTAAFYVLDIDDLSVFQREYPELAERLAAECPYYLSRGKRYPHYLVRVEDFPKERYSKTGALKRLHKLRNEAGELLTGQGTWVRPDDAVAPLKNGDRAPMLLKFRDLVPPRKRKAKASKAAGRGSKAAPAASTSGGHAGNAEATASATPPAAFPPPPLDEMRALLAMIDPVRFIAPREPWLKIGTALRGAYGDEDGFSLFDEVSARAPDAYAGTEETRRMFQGMSSAGVVGVGTIVHYARESDPASARAWKEARMAAERDGVIEEACRKWGAPADIVAYACADGCQVLQGEDVGMAQIYMRMRGGEIKFVDTSGKGDAYMWCPEKRLWVFWPGAFVKVKIQKVIRPVVMAAIDVGLADGSIEKPAFARCIRTRVISTQHASGIMQQAQNMSYAPKFAEVIDREPDELPIRGGLVLHLPSGEVRPRTREDLWSFELDVSHQEVGVDAAADALQLLRSICAEPEGGPLTDYLTQILGYSITGRTTERHFYIFHGNGRNGKSTLIEAVLVILGPLGVSLADAALLDQGGRSGSLTPELMPLMKARVGVLSETVRGAKLDPKRVKTLTGNDKICARALYKDCVEFRPQTKYLFASNYLPEYDARDQAMNDRLRLMPFLARFEVTPENNAFVDCFKTHGPQLDALFALMVKGAQQYYAAGCIRDPPACAVSAMATYRGNLDLFGAWLSTCVKGDDAETGKPLRWKKTECFASFRTYAEKEGADSARDCPQLKRKVFYEALVKADYKIKTVRGTGYVYSLGPAVQADADACE